MFMKKTIAITGAGGTVGMSLTKYFLKADPEIEIRAIDRSEAVIPQLIDLSRDNKNLRYS
jgi:FlaA1/EpsC-like NDP-sugar epimerase